MWKSHIIVIFFYTTIQFSSENCGKAVVSTSSTEAHKDRIVGGYDMGYYKYPWYVALISNKIVGCGGALVNSRTILTAAHCFRSSARSKLEDYYTIKMGVYNVCRSENTQVELKAEKVYVHELYAKENPYYDIALMSLSKDAAKFTPICMPSHPILNRPREGLVPGLGVLKYEGATPCTLHETRLLIHPDDECKSMLNSVEKNVSHIIKAFCAGYTQGGIDTCQGDSGGPLQVIGADGEYTLLGIVSFGYKCAAPGLLGLYTDVSQHLDWIKKHATGSLLHGHDAEQNANNETDPTTLTIEQPSPTQPAQPLPPAISVPLPFIGQRPAPFLQFYPVRPVNSKPSNSPVNIFIVNKRNRHNLVNQDKTNNSKKKHDKGDLLQKNSILEEI